MGTRVRQVGGMYPAQHETPLTGATITMTASQLNVKPAGTIAALTVNLPPDPFDGEEVGVNTTQIVTALTVASTVGHTIANAPTAGTAGGFFRMKYRLADTTWYRIG